MSAGPSESSGSVGLPEPVVSFSQIALDLHDADGSEETVERIVEFSRIALASDDAGVLILRSRSRIEVAASTSEAASQAHLLEVQLDEGPCLDAIEDFSTVYRINDTTTDLRWPRWSAAVVQLGFRSVLAAPLATNERRYGSINVLAHRPNAFDEDDEAVAMILARHASVALAASHDIEGLRKAMDARKLIGIAMGILMERYSIEHQQAFDVLRRYSQASNIKLRDVAQQVVAEGALPSDQHRLS
ncbi:MAG: GAF and ANTAR domain-containing protein [Nocardioidaceae bacterium]|nr:MAG: GAF and ANTAR domain-containing protein [Nocardioidaceae bacterium]